MLGVTHSANIASDGAPIQGGEVERDKERVQEASVGILAVQSEFSSREYYYTWGKEADDSLHLRLELYFLLFLFGSL